MTPHPGRLLVVGASSGIGREIALEAARRGAEVVAAARSEPALRELAQESPRITACRCDVTVPTNCEHVVTEAVARLGGLDGVIYATGITTLIELARATPEHWQRALATNLLGVTWLAAAALPHLGANAGRLMCLSSDITLAPRYGLGIYAATKAGLDQLVIHLRLEHPEVGIASVRVGPTVGTSIHRTWDEDAMRRITPRWEPVDVQTAEVVGSRIVDAWLAPQLPARVDLV